MLWAISSCWWIPKLLSQQMIQPDLLGCQPSRETNWNVHHWPSQVVVALDSLTITVWPIWFSHAVSLPFLWIMCIELEFIRAGSSRRWRMQWLLLNQMVLDTASDETEDVAFETILQRQCRLWEYTKKAKFVYIYRFPGHPLLKSAGMVMGKQWAWA